jgi:hypothetical protein
MRSHVDISENIYPLEGNIEAKKRELELTRKLGTVIGEIAGMQEPGSGRFQPDSKVKIN